MGPFPVSPPGRGWNVLGEEGEASKRKLLSPATARRHRVPAGGGSSSFLPQV